MKFKSSAIDLDQLKDNWYDPKLGIKPEILYGFDWAGAKIFEEAHMGAWLEQIGHSMRQGNAIAGAYNVGILGGALQNFITNKPTNHPGLYAEVLSPG